jgi:N-acetylglucosamine kinase-like BadF-type ATPase
VGSGGAPVNGATPAVLAVDGGNSKTDLALVSADGTVLAAVRGAGLTSDLGTTLGVLAGLVQQVRCRGGPRDGPVAAHLSACVANADLPEEEKALAAALRARGWAATTEVRNDTFAVLRTGVDDHERPPWGVAVTCGAGINCVGVAPDGRTARFLALGAITGDWGGGDGLGLAALWWAMRAEDGRGPQTALRAAVAAHFGLSRAEDVAIGVHTGAISEDRLRELAPAVLAAAGAGDAVAQRLVRRQASEICLMALTAMRRLGLAARRTRVVLGGAVVATRDRMLISAITQGIAAEAPGAQVRITEIPPVAGAALLGLDHLAAGAAAYKQLRAAYETAGGTAP